MNKLRSWLSWRISRLAFRIHGVAWKLDYLARRVTPPYKLPKISYPPGFSVGKTIYLDEIDHADPVVMAELDRLHYASPPRLDGLYIPEIDDD